MKRYRVTKIAGEMVVEPDIGGSYRASSPEEIKRALSELRYHTTTAEVLIGKTWYPLRKWKQPYQRARRHYSEPEPIRALPIYLRILKRLRLYKDPLEILIYRG